MRDEEIDKDLIFVEKEGEVLTPAERLINRFVDKKLGNENLKNSEVAYREIVKCIS